MKTSARPALLLILGLTACGGAALDPEPEAEAVTAALGVSCPIGEIADCSNSCGQGGTKECIFTPAGPRWSSCQIVPAWDGRWSTVARPDPAASAPLGATAFRDRVALVTGRSSGGVLLLERVAGAYGSWTSVGTADLGQPAAAFSSDGALHLFARRRSTGEIVHAKRSPTTGAWSSFASRGRIPGDTGGSISALAWRVAGVERVDAFGVGTYRGDGGEIIPGAIFRTGASSAWLFTGASGATAPLSVVSRADNAFDAIYIDRFGAGVRHSAWSGGLRSTTALGGPNLAGVAVRLAASSSSADRIDVLLAATGSGLLANARGSSGWEGFVPVFSPACTSLFGVALAVTPGSCAARAEAWITNGASQLYTDHLSAPAAPGPETAGTCR